MKPEKGDTPSGRARVEGSCSHDHEALDLKRYHLNEPAIIDVTSYEDIPQAIEDGRLGRIIDEHTRYMKETGREIRAL